MDLDHKLTIGDILKKGDDKSLIFHDIHKRIFDLCVRGDDDEESEFSAIFYYLEINDIDEFISECEHESDGDSFKPDISLILLALITYRDAVKFWKNQEIQISNLISSVFKPPSDLQLLNETYKTLRFLEDYSSSKHGIDLHNRFAPLEFKRLNSKKMSSAAKAKDEAVYGEQRRKVYALWDSGRWSTPSKAAEDIHQEAREEGQPFSVSVLKITLWIRAYKKQKIDVVQAPRT